MKRLGTIAALLGLGTAGCPEPGTECALEVCEAWTCGEPRPDCPCSDLCERPICAEVTVFVRNPDNGSCTPVASPCDVPDGEEYYLDSGSCEVGRQVCSDESPCAEGQVCDIRSCARDAVGTCVAQPEGCAEGGEPVFACDGTEYANDCERLRAGDRLGAIGSVTTPCTESGVWARDPASGDCSYYASSCYAPTDWSYYFSRDECEGPACSGESVWVFDPETGTCVEYASDCDVPVGNEFFASSAACEVDVPAVAGGSCSSDRDCVDGWVCDAEGCGRVTTGTCTIMPGACIMIEAGAEVCGCDGVTYATDCDRLMTGVARAHFGSC
jgi:hypothetical protein